MAVLREVVMRIAPLTTGLVAALSAITVQTANADTLRTPFLTVTANDSTFQGLPPLIATDVNDEGNATATGGIGFDPNVTASASTTGTSNHNSAMSNLIYYFEVMGPSNPNVSLVTQGTISTSLSVFNEIFDYSFAAASFSIGTCSGIANGDCGSSFSSLPVDVTANGQFSTTFSIPSDTIYEVTLNANVDTVDSFDTKTASASVDPTIGFDPFFNSNGYQLLFSDGVGPTASARRWRREVGWNLP